MRAPVDHILVKLRDLDRLVTGSSATGYMAQCPAHNDREPSLSIGEGDGGRALVHCFAGCTTDQILAALGLGFHELFPEHTWPPHLAQRPDGESSRVPRARSDSNPDRALPPSRPCSRSRSRSTEFSETTGDTERADEHIARRVRAVERGQERVDFDVPLNLDRLRRQASVLRALALRVAIVMALALTDGDAESTPLPVGLVALLMGKDPRNDQHRRQAWNARKALVERKILRWDRRLPSRHET